LNKGSIASVAVALAIALIVAGCGGSDNEIKTSSLSKDEYVAKADAACTKVNERLAVEFSAYAKKTGFKLNKKPTEKRASSLIENTVAKSVKGEVIAIRALGAPSGYEDRIEAILGSVEDGLDTARKNPKVVVEDISIAFGESDRLGEEFGFKVCAQR
jgi:hypothetical protein